MHKLRGQGRRLARRTARGLPPGPHRPAVRGALAAPPSLDHPRHAGPAGASTRRRRSSATTCRSRPSPRSCCSPTTVSSPSSRPECRSSTSTACSTWPNRRSATPPTPAEDSARSQTGAHRWPARNSFDARSTLSVGGRDVTDLPDSTRSTAVRTCCPTASRCCSRTCCATRTAHNVTADQIRALAGWDPDAEPDTEIQFSPARVAHAGLHRRALRRRPRRDARGDAGPRRRPREDQPAGAGRARHRPLRDRRRLRRAGRLRPQRRAGVRAQPRALPVPALGAERLRRLPGRAAGHRHRATRSTSSTWPGSSSTRDGTGLPRHPGRHRLAHHDDQRPRRPRLGRRRHRGRGGDARPAGRRC